MSTRELASDSDTGAPRRAASPRLLGEPRIRTGILWSGAIGALAVALVFAYGPESIHELWRAPEQAEVAAHAKSYGSGLRNRLRVADHALRAIANEMADRGLDAAVDGSATRHYFAGVGVIGAKGGFVPLYGTMASPPELSPLMLQDVAKGDTAVLSSEIAGRAVVWMARGLGRSGVAQGTAVAALAPQYLWERVDGNQTGTRPCVRDEAGTVLYCADPAHVSSTRAVGLERLHGRDGTVAPGGDGQSSPVGYMRFDLPTSDFAGSWTVTVLGSRDTPKGVLSAGNGQLLLGAGVLAAVILWFTRRRNRTTLRNAGALAPAAADDASANPRGDTRAPAFAASGSERQRNAIRAMAEIDRAILADAPHQKLIELAVMALPGFADCDVVMIAEREDDLSERLQLVMRKNGTDLSIQTGKSPADDSFDRLLGTPPDGAWVQDPAAHACLAAQVQLGVTRALVIPLFADATPVAFISLGLVDRNQLAPDATSYARALADRLGVALTAASRKAIHQSSVNFDKTTGLPNRQHLVEHLPQHIARTRREAKRLALLFIDLDDFREVNAAAGHAAGDRILREAAARLHARLRDEDLLVRFGSDEFVIVLPQIGRPVDAIRVAEASIAALNEPFTIEDEECRLGASIGISVLPDDAQCPETLLRHADAAMFRAKEEGRGRYAFYDNDVNQSARQRVSLERDLRAALTNDELYLVYQPQFDLRGGNIDGAEVLLRWRHPRRGMVPPSQFIPLAEQTSLIVDLGDFVLRRTCEQHVLWERAGVAPPRLSINLTEPEIRRKDFLAKVDGVLQETGMRPHCLEFEITERLFVADSTATLEKLGVLRERGIHISIDDFGTGYSSLSYLKRLPCDVVKIDQSFVQDLVTDSDSASIVRAIISMAHSLGRKVIAEGVETAPAREYLAQSGCDRGQGYLWSLPLPADEFVAFCRQHGAACESTQGVSNLS
jgi:diguanylate cyclase (GGDEF)-like protein